MNGESLIKPGMSAAVVGCGRAGLAMVEFLAHSGVRVLASDTRFLADFTGNEQDLLKRCTVGFEGGGHSVEFLRQAELIVVSPGVDLRHPALTRLRNGGAALVGELAVAAPLLRAPVIAITGTNGKTTVTEVVGALLQEGGRRVFVGGNIGTPVGTCLLEATDVEAIVLEVSSFQLELSGGFIPRVGVLLNITPDHLDRHGSLDHYAAAKMRIFQGGPEHTDVVINGDDALTATYLPAAVAAAARRFGCRPGAAAMVDGEGVVLATDGGRQVFPLTGSSLNTASGRMNSAAALLAVQRFGLDPAAIQRTLATFQVGPHRMQMVAEVGGVRFINDSKGTNTGAVISALQQVGGRVILIAGGKDKGEDYRLLRDAVKQAVKHLVLIGEAAPSLAEALGDLVPWTPAESMEDAVRQSVALAVFGDTVLLSPACASFDMFANYKQRGDRFAAAVQKLAEGP